MANRVARYQADRTNQKLYFVRIYCQLAEQAENEQLKTAHLESALCHLYSSYLAFLQEIARYYQLSLSQPNLNGIEQALADKTCVSPEVLRLQYLVEQDFLGEIEQAWQQVLYKPTPKDSASVNSANRLPIVDVMANVEDSTISVNKITQWRSELMAVIDGLRENMVEF